MLQNQLTATSHLVYGISRWSNPKRAAARHLDNGNGLPLCGGNGRKVFSWEREEGEPTCQKCIKHAEEQTHTNSQDLRQQYRALNVTYPPTFRPKSDDTQSKRSYRSAVRKMRVIKKELKARGEAVSAQETEKPREEWGTFQVGDMIISEVWGRGVVTRVSRDEKMGDFVNFRVDADGKLRAQHVKFLIHMKEQ